MSSARAPREWGCVRKMRSGNLQASYKIGGVEVRAAQTFRSVGDARAWLAGERRLIERGDWQPVAQRVDAPKPVAPRLPTLETWAGDWMAAHRLRPETERTYERQLRLRILPGLGRKRLDQIDRAVVSQWWRAMVKHGQRRCHDQSYSLLKTILAAALDDGLISEQPCQVRGAGKPSRRRRSDPLTPAQVSALAALMPPRWRAGVWLAAWCGLRSGEVRALRRKDINLPAGVIRVRQGVTHGLDGLVVGPPKTEAGVRDVPIPAALLPVLVEHLAEHVGRFPDSLVIAGPDGAVVSDSRWGKMFTAACAAVGLEDVTFHDLRHTALTTMALAGATLAELQAIAGHTTADMAMRYQEVAKTHLGEVMGRVSDMMVTG